MNLTQQIANKRFNRIYDTAKAISLSNGEKESDINFAGEKSTGKIRIAYLMNHVRVCGGAKIILEHTNQLVDRGHEVYIVCRDAKPNWKEIKANYIQAEQQRVLVEFVPDVDIIVCTVADQVPESYLFAKAPVVLFEQGDTYIFEYDKVEEGLKDYFQTIWSIPIPIFGVSKVLIETIEKNFKRTGNIIHNALDKTIFYPRKKETPQKERLKVLFVGQEENTFKGIAVIRDAIQLVKDSGYDFEEVWVSQTPPKSNFEGTLIVNPTQEKLGETYRDCDIFVSGSFYESFSLPPLEAMASGCAVVATDNGGIREYAINGQNCLLVNTGDSQSLAEGIIELIEDEGKRQELVRHGYETADSFNWDVIMTEWEYLLSCVINFYKEEESLRPSLRLQRVPEDMSPELLIRYQDSILSNMIEDWCLFLFEGEDFEESLIPYIQQVIHRVKKGNFVVPVIYSDEVPGHPIVRLEKRLVSRNQHNSDSSLVLPLNISNGSANCFLPEWKREVNYLYKSGQYDSLISYLKSQFSALSNTEKLIACRWMVLALMETDRYQEAFSVIDSALSLDSSYSDLLYLCGRILLANNNIAEGKKFLEFAHYCGTSLFHEDAFGYMEEICTAYLNSL